MDANRLWAKSQGKGEPLTPSMLLPGHLEDVYRAAERVVTATTLDQLAALGLPDTFAERLRRNVLLAAALHDLGKANDHFQGMILRLPSRRDKPQGLRHEWVTLLMIEPLRQWLLPAVGSDVDLAMVEWAIAGHHPAHHHASPPMASPDGAGPEIRLQMGHVDFRAALDWIGDMFGLGNAPVLVDQVRNLRGTNDVCAHNLRNWSKNARRVWQKLERTPETRLVAAVKSTLIAADVAGSALPRDLARDAERWDWITKSFADRPETGDLQAVVDARLKGDELRPFQRAVAKSKALVTYVKAGCGTGKTVAAYQWAADNYPTRRLYFCYPTTGTATEGFKDYLFEPDGELGVISAKLFHSRRDVDFDIILTTGKDTKDAETDAANRLAALESWSTPVVACTVDTVLGLVQNNRRGLFAWPALAQSAFVFDEIHAYDDQLFGALLRFLRDVPGLPVLLMTASLPTAREEALRGVMAKLGKSLTPIPGPTNLEELPRYRNDTTTEEGLLDLVRTTLAKDGKVLWVCNTVGRVMDAADRMKEFGPLLYHSRFKYEDRVNRHKAVIDHFDRAKYPRGSLAICSQVAEMSLDLSADLLITDLAPVPALIQRLGRLNRRAKLGDATKPFVVIAPTNHLPYTPGELEAALCWLARLSGDGLSQRHLADAWEQAVDRPPEMIDSAWLDGGPCTTVKELRAGSPGITILLTEDLGRVKARPRDLARLVIPMPPPPPGLDWYSWPRERGLPVAAPEAVDYDPMRGAKWRK